METLDCEEERGGGMEVGEGEKYGGFGVVYGKTETWRKGGVSCV